MPLDPDLSEFTTAAPAIASFDFQDIADGTGIVEFSLCSEEDSVDVGYFITTKPLFSSSISLSNNVANTTTELEKDFDTLFNIPKTLNGDIFFNIHWIMNGGNSDSGSFFLTVELKHFDGSTETTIGSVIVSPTILKTSSGQVQEGAFLLKTTTGRVHFASGDILRASIKLTTQATNGNTNSAIGTDPVNRDFGTLFSSNSKILVPFVLQL